MIVDHYLWGTCNRVSQEAPVQIVEVESESVTLGGAGNVVSNLKALGAEVAVVSVIGDCFTSTELKQLLGRIGVEKIHLTIEQGRIAARKTRIISGQQQVIRYDRENTSEINIQSETEVIDSCESMMGSYDVVLISDYGKGVVTTQLAQGLIRSARKAGKRVLVDPKGNDYTKYKGAFLLTPNKKEAGEALGFKIEGHSSLRRALKQMKADYDLQASIITMSEDGIAAFEKDLQVHPAVAREVFDVTGAGDTVLASLGFMLAGHCTVDEAVEFANLAAGVVVGKVGSATATRYEVLEYQTSLNKSNSSSQVKNIAEIAEIAKELNVRGKKIVFTNGCFDILHAGHVACLEAAKKFGDVLIVGVNSDRSVRSLKGANRPINNEQDRTCVLAGLGSVDYVVLFDEDTPLKIIEKIRPQILIKGGDYEGKELIGQEIVQEVKTVPFVLGKSTTKLIEKIQQGL